MYIDLHTDVNYHNVANKMETHELALIKYSLSIC